jgi:hypothetical protein
MSTETDGRDSESMDDSLLDDMIGSDDPVSKARHLIAMYEGLKAEMFRMWQGSAKSVCDAASKWGLDPTPANADHLKLVTQQHEEANARWRKRLEKANMSNLKDLAGLFT